MATSVTAPGDRLKRREKFRAYMKAFNPTAPAREVIEAGLVYKELHSSLFQNLGARADLEPGSQQLLVGGIGSGKTTELMLAQGWVSERGHILPLYIDISAETDLSGLASGSLLAAFGLHLARRLIGASAVATPELANATDLKKTYIEVSSYAYGKSVFVHDPRDDDSDYDDSDYDDSDYEPGYYRFIPGKLKPPIPALQRDVREIRQPLEQLLMIARDGQRDVVAIFDGLDRLLDPAKFWTLVHQDLRLLRDLRVSVLATAPISVRFGGGLGQALSDQFDRVHDMPAVATDPDQGLLQAVLATRGGYDLLSVSDADSLCHYSGGVLRDLISLVRDAAEEAYVSDRDSITAAEIEKVVHQLGTAYLRGLGPEQIKTLLDLEKSKSFQVDQPANVELLVTRRVLEYSATDFRVHPALLAVIPRPESKSA